MHRGVEFRRAMTKELARRLSRSGDVVTLPSIDGQVILNNLTYPELTDEISILNANQSNTLVENNTGSIGKALTWTFDLIKDKKIQNYIVYLGNRDWLERNENDGDFMLRITTDDWKRDPFNNEARIIDIVINKLGEITNLMVNNDLNFNVEDKNNIEFGQNKIADLVMQGGITSGIVYPKAISEISRFFIFKRIGGTSAGAIAAAFAAAAEHQRCLSGSTEGFRQLNKLSSSLSSIDGQGTTLLRSLFRPQKKTRHLFELLSAIITPYPTLPILTIILKDHSFLLLLIFIGIVLLILGKLLIILMLIPYLYFRLWKTYIYNIIIIIVVLLTVAGIVVDHTLLAKESEGTNSFFPITKQNGERYWFINFTGTFLTFIGCAGLLSVFSKDIFVNLSQNHHGLCSGWLDRDQFDKRDDPNGGEMASKGPLTRWLSNEIDRIAGISKHDAPLTFGHLRRPGFMPKWDYAEYVYSRRFGNFSTRDTWLNQNENDDQNIDFDNPDEWKIDLRLFTTSVGLGRPFTLPFHTRNFGILDADLVKFFPGKIVAYVRDHASWHDDILIESVPRKIVGLPSPEDLPVIIAVRLSLSFPILFSAIPLYSRGSAEQIYFSDGGLTSNFPMTLFDEPFPERPVLALNLLYSDDIPSENDEDNVAIFEAANVNGIMGIQVRKTLTVFEFLFGIFETARLWFDTMSLNTPGMQERVARIMMFKGDGGLNLNMNPDTIDRLAERGRIAGRRLAVRFFDSSQPLGFAYHQGIRGALLASDLARMEFNYQANNINHWQDGVTSLGMGVDEVNDNLEAFYQAKQMLVNPNKHNNQYPSLRFRPPFSI